MKTSELNGAALDWAAALCDGITMNLATKNSAWISYSTDWAQGGPIIEREGVSIDAHLDREEWIARNYWGMHEQQGATPLIAAMRCYVASKLGNDVQLPEELK